MLADVAARAGMVSFARSGGRSRPPVEGERRAVKTTKGKDPKFENTRAATSRNSATTAFLALGLGKVRRVSDSVRA